MFCGSTQKTCFIVHLYRLTLTNKKKIDELQVSLRTALRAFSALEYELQSEIESCFAKNRDSVETAIVWTARDGKPPHEPLVVHRSFESLLKTVVGHFHGLDPEQANLNEALTTRTAECARVSRLRLKSMSSSEVQRGATPTESTKRTPEKIALIDNLRRYWRNYAGEKPPRITSSGEYLNFVQDVIWALGYDWDAESCMRAWSRNRRRPSVIDITDL